MYFVKVVIPDSLDTEPRSWRSELTKSTVLNTTDPHNLQNQGLWRFPCLLHGAALMGVGVHRLGHAANISVDDPDGRRRRHPTCSKPTSLFSVRADTLQMQRGS